jgi:L-fuconolactonase
VNGRIDSHQHFWRLDRGDYDWLTPKLEPIYRDYLPGDLTPQLSRAGVDSTVLVQAAPTIAETQFMLDLAAEHAFIAGVVGWANFESPVAAETIATLADNSSLVGLRPMIQDIPDAAWMLKPELAPAIEAMIDHDLVFDALLRPLHLPVLRDFADLYPELRLVVNHGAKPALAGGDVAEWRRDLAVVAQTTNAVCKLSGLVTESGSANPALLVPCVDHLLEIFGPKRMMWGSDWPVCELVCSYEEWYQACEMLLVRLSEADREQIFSGTARETYGI